MDLKGNHFLGPRNVVLGHLPGFNYGPNVMEPIFLWGNLVVPQPKCAAMKTLHKHNVMPNPIQATNSFYQHSNGTNSQTVEGRCTPRQVKPLAQVEKNRPEINLFHVEIVLTAREAFNFGEKVEEKLKSLGLNTHLTFSNPCDLPIILRLVEKNMIPYLFIIQPSYVGKSVVDLQIMHEESSTRYSHVRVEDALAIVNNDYNHVRKQSSFDQHSTTGGKNHKQNIQAVFPSGSHILQLPQDKCCVGQQNVDINQRAVRSSVQDTYVPHNVNNIGPQYAHWQNNLRHYYVTTPSGLHTSYFPESPEAVNPINIVGADLNSTNFGNSNLNNKTESSINRRKKKKRKKQRCNEERLPSEENFVAGDDDDDDNQCCYKFNELPPQQFSVRKSNSFDKCESRLAFTMTENDRKDSCTDDNPGLKTFSSRQSNYNSTESYSVAVFKEDYSHFTSEELALLKSKVEDLIYSFSTHFNQTLRFSKICCSGNKCIFITPCPDSANWLLSQVFPKMNGKELHVEPFSNKKTKISASLRDCQRPESEVFIMLKKQNQGLGLDVESWQMVSFKQDQNGAFIVLEIPEKDSVVIDSQLSSHLFFGTSKICFNHPK